MVIRVGLFRRWRHSASIEKLKSKRVGEAEVHARLKKELAQLKAERNETIERNISTAPNAVPKPAGLSG
jgi:hypothetical protein